MSSQMSSAIYFQLIFKANTLRIIKEKGIALTKHMILVKFIITSGLHISQEAVNLIRMFWGKPIFLRRDQTLSFNVTAHCAKLNRILEYVPFAQNVFCEGLWSKSNLQPSKRKEGETYRLHFHPLLFSNMTQILISAFWTCYLLQFQERALLPACCLGLSQLMRRS